MPSNFSSEIKLTGVSWPLPRGQRRGEPGASQPGQLVRAQVEQVKPDGVAILRLGDRRVQVVTRLELVRGQELTLKVNAGEPQPSFTIVRVSPPPGPARLSAVGLDPGDPTTRISQIQALLSKQQTLTSLLRFLQIPASPELLGALPGLFGSLLSKHCAGLRDIVHPQLLRGAIQDSGLVLEARVAQLLQLGALLPGAAASSALPPELRGDLKLLMWQMLAAVTPDQESGALAHAAAEQQQKLMRLLEGVAAQISLRQLHAVHEAEKGNFGWSMELPLFLDEELVPLAITISRDHAGSHAQPQPAPSWRVELSVDLEPLGPVTVALYIRDQNLSVSLQAERESAVESLRADLGELEQTLVQHGFSVEALLSRPLPTGLDQGEELSEFNHLLEVSA